MKTTEPAKPKVPLTESRGGYSANPLSLLQRRAPVKNPIRSSFGREGGLHVLQGFFDVTEPVNEIAKDNIAYTKAFFSKGIEQYAPLMKELIECENVLYKVETHPRTRDIPGGVYGKTALIGKNFINTIIYKTTPVTDEATFLHEMTLHALPIFNRIKNVERGVAYRQTTNDEDHGNLANWGRMLVTAARMIARKDDGVNLYIKVIADMSEHLFKSQFEQILGHPDIKPELEKNGLAMIHATTRASNFKESTSSGSTPPVAAPTGAAVAGAIPSGAAYVGPPNSSAATASVAPAKKEAMPTGGATASSSAAPPQSVDQAYADFAAEMKAMGVDLSD